MTQSSILPRRHFVGIAAVAIASAAPVPTFAGVKRRSLAANAFGLRSHLVADFGGTLRALRRIGLKRIELVSFKGWDGHPYGSFTAISHMTGRAVKSALKDAGLTASSSHVLPTELTPQRLRGTTAWMREIGVKTLIMAGLPLADTGDTMVRAIESLNETGRRLADEGCRLLLHGDYALFRRHDAGTYFDDFVARVDPAACVLQLDLGATLQMGIDAAQILRSYKRHIGSLHLRDGKPSSNPEIYVPSMALGEGRAPLPAILDAALEADLSDFVLEMVMRPEGGEIEALARSYRYLQKVRPELVR